MTMKNIYYIYNHLSNKSKDRHISPVNIRGCTPSVPYIFPDWIFEKKFPGKSQLALFCPSAITMDWKGCFSAMLCLWLYQEVLVVPDPSVYSLLHRTVPSPEAPPSRALAVSGGLYTGFYVKPTFSSQTLMGCFISTPLIWQVRN